MENNVADAAVGDPQLAAAADDQAATPSESSLTTGPPVTGAQIAALATTPARDRTAALVAERAKAEAAEAERARAEADDDSDGSEYLRELRQRFKKACDEGIIEGAVCRGS